jgi:GT2 family glycosyltransferase
MPQIIVVDGGSFDGCAEMLAVEFPEAHFVQSKENIGFGRCNNLGFSYVMGEAVLLLNPDTEIMSGSVQRLLRELDRLPQAGIVGPRLLNSDLTLQASVHALPRPVLQAFDSEFLRRLLSGLSCWGPPMAFAPAEPMEVEAVAGACMLLSRKTFHDVRGFTPEYFMYAEDMDLCLKVRSAGLKIYHVPQAAIIHHSGVSSSAQGTKFAAVMMREALHTYMRLNRGRLSAFSYRVSTGISAAVRLLVMIPAVLLARGETRGTVRASISKWRSILSWSVGLESWAKQYR